MADDFKVITTNVVSSVEQVRLYDETVAHVEKNHPEVPARLPSIVAAVESTVQNPTHVEKSYGNSYVFVDSETTNKSGDAFRVPVKVVEGTSACVKTFFFGSNEVAPENIIWRRGKNDGK
jgi:hypothetical protein